jgi:hypothetical protein
MAARARCLASTILKNEMIDASAASIAVAAPGNPGAAPIDTDAARSADDEESDFFSTPGGYAVIAVLIAVGLALIIGLAFFLGRRSNRGARKDESDERAVEMPSVGATETTRAATAEPLDEPPRLSATGSRRSRRQQPPAVPVRPAATYGGDTGYSAPPPAVGYAPVTLPPPPHRVSRSGRVSRVAEWQASRPAIKRSQRGIRDHFRLYLNSCLTSYFFSISM